jgi:hypothetical protein
MIPARPVDDRVEVAPAGADPVDEQHPGAATPVVAQMQRDVAELDQARFDGRLWGEEAGCHKGEILRHGTG